MIKLLSTVLRLSDMPGKVAKIADEMSRCMTGKWVGLRGFTVVSTAMESLTVCDRDMRIIQTIERAKINRDPAMAAATLTTAQADAMTDAARNESGGLFTVSAVYPAASVHPSPLPNVPSAPTAQKIPNVSAAPNPQPTQNIFLEPDNSDKPRLWYCPNCRKMLTSKFCPDCGAKRKK